jgi:hypothetical protein
VAPPPPKPKPPTPALPHHILGVFTAVGSDTPLAAIQLAQHLQADADDVERALRADQRFGECGTVRLKGGVITTAWRLVQPTPQPRVWQHRY